MRSTNAEAYAADQLFATLDTTTRQLHLDGVARSVALSDTVGFIRDLPHTLIEAFQATLQEAADADLLVHVVDGANPEARRADDRGAARARPRSAPATCPRLVVFNKIDRLEDDRAARASLRDGSIELTGGGERVPSAFRERAQRPEGLADVLKPRSLVAAAYGESGRDA